MTSCKQCSVRFCQSSSAMCCVQVAAACLYIICRQDNKPFMLIDFSDQLQVNVYALGSVWAQLCRQLHLEQSLMFTKYVLTFLYLAAVRMLSTVLALHSQCKSPTVVRF